MRILVGFVCTMVKSHGHDQSRNVLQMRRFMWYREKFAENGRSPLDFKSARTCVGDPAVVDLGVGVGEKRDLIVGLHFQSHAQ